MDNKEDKISRREATLKKHEELEKRMDELSEDEYLKAEKEIDVDDLIEELTPLLKDFFVGEFINVHNMILCTFYNGDKFNISIEKAE